MSSGDIPKEILENFDFFLVMVDGHRRDKLHPGCIVTHDIYKEPLMVRYDHYQKKFFVMADLRKNEELDSEIEAWLPINIDRLFKVGVKFV